MRPISANELNPLAQLSPLGMPSRRKIAWRLMRGTVGIVLELGGDGRGAPLRVAGAEAMHLTQILWSAMASITQTPSTRPAPGGRAEVARLGTAWIVEAVDTGATPQLALVRADGAQRQEFAFPFAYLGEVIGCLTLAGIAAAGTEGRPQ